MKGRLLLRKHKVGTSDPEALIAELLLEGDAAALPPLHRATVRAISEGGLVIRGTEIISRATSKARVQSYPQAWWCLIHTENLLQRMIYYTPLG